jgi:4-amino-4-deoxy-L-arabinose transferase-like glycosyltransferase
MTVPLEREAVPSPLERATLAVQERRLLLEVLAVTLTAVLFLVSVLPNLPNHPTLTDDEGWVLSASYKLAREGVFGSDMFAGFYNADRYYLFNMPGHHFAVAGAFKLIGYGVLEARLVGVFYGLATIILVYLFARRIFGIPTAMVSLALLLFVRFNMGFDTGLPLQELAANLRYDLAPVPFLLVGLLLLLQPPSLTRAAVAGALFGIAILLQFYAAFMVPVALAFFAFEAVPRQQKLRVAGSLVAACALVGLPYGVYVLAHLEDFRGQAGTVESRADFTSPGFYVNSLLNEPNRFIRPLAFKEVPRGADHELTDPRVLSLRETATRRPSARLAVLVGLPASIAFLAWRVRNGAGRGELLLLLVLVGLPLQYALFESLKLYIYWVAVVPFLCIGMAAVAVRALQAPRASPAHFAAAVVVAGSLFVFFAEGSVARLSGFRAAQNESDYMALSAAIQRHVPDGARVVGSTSLWWGMRDYDYRSYFLFFYLTNPDAGPYRTTISGFLNEFQPEYIVLTRLAIGELEKHLYAGDYADWDLWMTRHATKVARIEGPAARSYGFIDIWRIDY